MKQRQIPVRRLFWILLGAFLVVKFFQEYPWIAFFAAIWLALTVGWMLVDWFRTKRREERIEDKREELDRIAMERRMQAFRKAHYSPEDLAALESHINEHLGPIVQLERQADPESLPIDAALLAPTEEYPFWRAVTLGMGACAEDWVRAEMVIPLEADWDPEDLRPFRLLRDAARQFLAVQGWVGPGSACKGSMAFINEGFAGGVLYDGLRDLPDPKSVNLPGAGPVMFYWLLPLKKPEWDYCGERGLDALERRMDHPASYLVRTPWVDSRTWFEEDIMPFRWSENGELYCLGLNESFWFQALFQRAGVLEFGWALEMLAESILWEGHREDLPFVEFACEGYKFFAASRDEEILRRLALELSDLLRYQPDRAVARLLSER